MLLPSLLIIFYLLTFALAIYLLKNSQRSFLIFKITDYPALGRAMRTSGILLVIIGIIGIIMLFVFNIKLNLIPIGIICIIIIFFSINLIRL